MYLKLESSQNGKEILVEEPAGAKHISEIESDGLTIFVPREKKAQELCFSSELPRKFAQWLLEDPAAGKRAYKTNNEAVKTLTAIFTCSLYVAEDILDRQGIVSIPIENIIVRLHRILTARIHVFLS